MGRAASTRARSAALLVIALLVIALAVVGLGRPVAATADDWDPRIVGIVRAVERLRGLEFEHPVPVEVLGDRAFEQRYLAGGEPSRRDRREWDDTQAAFVALGLLDQPVYLDAARAASGTNVAGFYDPHRKTIVVRGSRFDDPGTRVVLAHELTHALQDQHFGIAALQRRATKADSIFTKALIEGDATDVERRYFAGLSAREQDAASAANDAGLAEAAPLPPFLDAVFYAPYALGAETVAVLRALGGRPGLDAVMRTPPTRDLGLVDPTALVGRHEWVDVDAPALDPGDVARGDPFPMDAVGIYLVLAERLPFTDALAAAERWGGDRTVTFTRAGRPCVRMRIAGRHGASDADALGDAFRRWATGGGTDTEVTRDGTDVRITLCDPVDHGGAAVPAPAAQAIVGLTIRNDLVAGLVDRGSSLAVAKCTADRLAQLPETGSLVTAITSLADEVPDERSAALRAAIARHLAGFERACTRSS